MSRETIFTRDNFLCRYCRAARATHIDHVVARALRRRHHIADSDERYHVSSCPSCNWRKLTFRLYPSGFDVSLLPGKGWRMWDGGAL